MVAFPRGAAAARSRSGAAVVRRSTTRKSSCCRAATNGAAGRELLLRRTQGCWSESWSLDATPVGFVPTEIDYSDYRDVAGVKMPFKRTVSQTYMQMTIELSDVQPNATIDAARFAQPRP